MLGLGGDCMRFSAQKLLLLRERKTTREYEDEVSGRGEPESATATYTLRSQGSMCESVYCASLILLVQ